MAAAKKLHKDMAAAMKALVDAGWTVEPAQGKSHAAYITKCPHGCCHKSISGTPRNPTGAAKAMERWPRKCAKGTN